MNKIWRQLTGQTKPKKKVYPMTYAFDSKGECLYIKEGKHSISDFNDERITLLNIVHRNGKTTIVK